jgi:hypothetical protein
LGNVFVDKCFEAFVSGDVFLDGGHLVPGDVFGDIAAVLAALEVVVGLAVGTDADDGEVAAFHAGDGGHLLDAVGQLGGLHGGSICQTIYPSTKKCGNLKISLPLRKICPAPCTRRKSRLSRCGLGCGAGMG